MEVRVRITVEDYRAYLKAIQNFLRSGDYTRRTSLRFIGMTVAMGVAIAAALIVMHKIIGHRVDLISVLLGMIIILAIFVIFIKRHQSKLIPKHDGILIGDHVFTFTNVGFSDKTSLFETSLLWDAVITVQETDRHFFIFLDTVQAYFIPKRDLGAQENILQLRNLLQDRVG